MHPCFCHPKGGHLIVSNKLFCSRDNRRIIQLQPTTTPLSTDPGRRRTWSGSFATTAVSRSERPTLPATSRPYTEKRASSVRSAVKCSLQITSYKGMSTNAFLQDFADYRIARDQCVHTNVCAPMREDFQCAAEFHVTKFLSRRII